MHRLAHQTGVRARRVAAIRVFVFVAFVAAVLIGQVRDTQAFPPPQDIFGCPFDGNYTSCAQAKLQKKLDDTAHDWQSKLDGLRTQYENSPFYVKLTMEKDELQAFRTQQIAQLVTCLASTGVDRANALKAAVRMTSDPAAFVAAVAGDAWSTVQPVVDGIVTEDLAPLARPPGPPRAAGMGAPQVPTTAPPSPPPPPDPGQVADKIWARIQQLGQRDAITGCFVSFIRPMYPAIRQAAVNASNTMNAKLASLYADTIRPIIGKAIAKLVGALIEKGFGAEGTEVAKGIVATKLLGPDRMSRSADKLRALALALRQNQPYAQPLAEAKKALDTNFTVDSDLTIELAGELLRIKGHDLIWSSDEGSLTSPPGGAAIVQKGLDAASSVLALANGIIDSACGLVPEGGAAVCSMLITRTLRFTWQLGAGILKWGTLKAMNVAMNRGIDYAKAKLKAQGKRLDADVQKMKEDAGPFGTEFDAIGLEAAKAYAAPFVAPVKASIDEYNAAVRELVDAAVARSK